MECGFMATARAAASAITKRIYVRITATDATGTEYEGELELLPVMQQAGQARPLRKKVSAISRSRGEDIDLDLPLRAFLKRYARGKSGAVKFTILLAFLAKGKVET